MSLFSKRKQNYVAAPAKTCSRCHERIGTLEVPPINQPGAGHIGSLWFCDECRAEIGRDGER